MSGAGAAVENRLLNSLPNSERRRLLLVSRTMLLVFGDLLYESGDIIRHVYFMVDAQASLIAVGERNEAIEIGTVGREGVVGISCAMGSDRSPVRALVQRDGEALQTSAVHFRAAFRKNSSLRRQILEYAQYLADQTAQRAVCSRFHVLEQRLACWLLVYRNRAGSGEMHLTHEFLADMLGVRRVGVTNAANALRALNLIDYRRGKVVISNAAGLEAVACSCYRRREALLR